MSIENLGRKHLTPAQVTAIDDAFVVIETILASVSQNLSDEERQRYGSINEQNKLFADKIMDYLRVSPQLRSPDVDWSEFEADYDTRKFADTRMLRIENILKVMSDLKIVHDYDNYQAGLVDYDFAKYKAGTNAVGYTQKAKELKQFFPNTGSSVSNGKKSDSDSTTNDTPPSE